MGVLGIHQILILVYDPRSHLILWYRYVVHLLGWTMLIVQGCSTTTNNTLREVGIWFLIVISGESYLL